MRSIMFRLGIASSILFAPLIAEIDAKAIAKNYQNGVVKILLYDSGLVDAFKLKKDQGYISRASGFFVENDGYLFTNAHVVDLCVSGYMILDWVDEDDKMHKADLVAYYPNLENDKAIRKIYYAGHATPVIQVFSNNGDDFDLYNAEILSMSTTFDGALIKVTEHLEGPNENGRFTYLPLGNSDSIVLGEDLIILGYPSQYMRGTFEEELKDTITMTFGKHSGWDYVFDENNGLIKTDASIHEGNSGGPVFGENQKVVGIATAMGAKTRIGLVGGINTMYYVVEPYKNLLKFLQKNGLSAPKKLGKMQVIPGTKLPVPNITPDRPVLEQALKSEPASTKQELKGLIRKDHEPLDHAEIEVWHYLDIIDDFILVTTAQTNQDGRYELTFNYDPHGLYLCIISAKNCKRYVKTLDKNDEMLGVSDIVLE
ncbi:MAG: trypsin-like peptidase domain-containing protein [Parachlamydiales bacterium]|nr:trypsin-like peptidase domain-containing protein [Parachlamydiales bacterium]